MKKLTGILFFLLAFFLLQPTTPVAAANQSCGSTYPVSSDVFAQTTFYAGNDYTPATVSVSGLVPGKSYYLMAIHEISALDPGRDLLGNDQTIAESSHITAVDNNGDGVGEITFTLGNNSYFNVNFHSSGLADSLQQDKANISLVLATDEDELQPCVTGGGPLGCLDHTPQLCNLYQYEIVKQSLGVTCDGFIVTQQSEAGCFTPGNATWRLEGLTNSDGTQYSGNVEIQFPGGGIQGNDQEFNYDGGVKTGDFQITTDKVGQSLEVIVHTEGGKICSFNVDPIKAACTDDEREREVAESTGNTDFNFELCEQIPDTNFRSECKTCWGRGGIWTAVGCVSYDPTQMVSTLMKIGISMAGGVALLMILAAGFMFSTSQGDPKKVSDAKELMTSAVIGLLFIIFSVTILQFIGINLLQIPGFGG